MIFFSVMGGRRGPFGRRSVAGGTRQHCYDGMQEDELGRLRQIRARHKQQEAKWSGGEGASPVTKVDDRVAVKKNTFSGSLIAVRQILRLKTAQAVGTGVDRVDGWDRSKLEAVGSV